MSVEKALVALSWARTALDEGYADGVNEPVLSPARAREVAIDRIDDAMRFLGANDERPNWERDEYQFPRLLAELIANVECLNDDQLRPVAESMDLDLSDVIELFDRAQAAWERIKAETT